MTIEQIWAAIYAIERELRTYDSPTHKETLLAQRRVLQAQLAVAMSANQDPSDAIHDRLTYDAALDRLISSVPLETTVNSYWLGKQHRIASGGDSVFFTDESLDVSYYPVRGGIKDQSQGAHRGVSGIVTPYAREYTPYETIAHYGGFRTAGELDYSTSIESYESFALVGVEFVPTVTQTADLTYCVYRGTDNTGTVIYEITLDDADMTDNTAFMLWFDHPLDVTQGTEFYEEILVGPEGARTPLKVRPAIGKADKPYQKFSRLMFTDNDVLTYKQETQRTRDAMSGVINGQEILMYGEFLDYSWSHGLTQNYLWQGDVPISPSVGNYQLIADTWFMNLDTTSDGAVTDIIFNASGYVMLRYVHDSVNPYFQSGMVNAVGEHEFNSNHMQITLGQLAQIQGGVTFAYEQTQAINATTVDVAIEINFVRIATTQVAQNSYFDVNSTQRQFGYVSLGASTNMGILDIDNADAVVWEVIVYNADPSDFLGKFYYDAGGWFPTGTLPGAPVAITGGVLVMNGGTVDLAASSLGPGVSIATVSSSRARINLTGNVQNLWEAGRTTTLAHAYCTAVPDSGGDNLITRTNDTNSAIDVLFWDVGPSGELVNSETNGTVNFTLYVYFRQGWYA